MALEMEARNRWPLAELLSAPEMLDTSEPNKEALEAQKYLQRLRELANGLVSSEYWELISLVLIDGCEEAKARLESVTTSDKDLRVSQGEAQAYRSAYNLIVNLSKEKAEEKHG